MAAGRLPVMLDAHVHLPAYREPEAVVETARRMGMRILSVTVSVEEVVRTFQLRERDPSTVRCFIGVHPSEAKKSHGDLRMIQKYSARADGIGEIGLDPKYSEVSSSSPQMELFSSQLEIAERIKKPVQIHSRDSEKACLDTLEGFSLKSVLLHWFEGEGSLGRVVPQDRFYVSFGPALLFSKKIARVAQRVPPDMVLAESDGPVAFAALGGAGGPHMIPSVVFKLAETWGRSFEDTLAQLSLNEKEYLG